MSENQIVYGATLFDKTVTEYEIVKTDDIDQYFDVIQLPGQDPVWSYGKMGLSASDHSFRSSGAQPLRYHAL